MKRQYSYGHLATILALVASTAHASPDSAGSIADALSGTKLLLDTRMRYETVNQDPMSNDAEAITLRARLGFETGKVWKTTFLADADLIWPLQSDYNSTTNGNTAYPIVADPESYEINRLQFTNTSLPMTTVTAGRQRINLDDQRFVGNVGWRQNEQTFDSLRVMNRSIKNFVVDVSYVNQVNRFFGKESLQGRYEGDSVLANVSYQLPIGKLTGFGYLLEFEPIAGVPAAARDSSETYGMRFAGEQPLSDFKLSYAASYATQSERGDNPLAFDLNYYLGELRASYQQYSLGVGAEVLEGDGIKGFATPLATLHIFQGWADKFGVTPVEGIEDAYLNARITLNSVGVLEGLTMQASYHAYEAERVAMDYGTEVNLQVLAKWKRFSGMLKYADYRSDGLFTDTQKFWLQMEYVW